MIAGFCCVLVLAIPLIAVGAELPTDDQRPVQAEATAAPSAIPPVETPAAPTAAATGAPITAATFALTTAPTPTAAPAAAPSPVIDPQASSGEVQLGDIKLQLELGPWKVEQLDRLLARAQAEFTDANARFAFLLDQLRRTPFAYEAMLAIPPPGTLRVRLQSFDCMGLVMYLLAMNTAGNFAEFIHALRHLRYVDSDAKGVDSDPVRGNILDFAEDVLLRQASAKGFLLDVTAEVAGKTPLSTFRSRVSPWRRSKNEDPGQRLVLPKLTAGRVLSLRMLSRKAFSRMDRSLIKSGDILLFSRIKPGAAARKQLMFTHVTVALNQGGEIYMVHASRDYLWRPRAKRGDQALASGVYYQNDPRREQLGVGPATFMVKDKVGSRSRIHGKTYHGYAPDRLRPVYDYLAGVGIQGVAVLRPLNPTPSARPRISSYKATP